MTSKTRGESTDDAPPPAPAAATIGRPSKRPKTSDVLAALALCVSLWAAITSNQTELRGEKRELDAAKEAQASRVYVDGGVITNVTDDGEYRRQQARIRNESGATIADIVILTPAADGTLYWAKIGPLDNCRGATLVYPEAFPARLEEIRVTFTDSVGNHWQRQESAEPQPVEETSVRPGDPNLYVPIDTTGGRAKPHVVFGFLPGCA